eukprot:Sspe_Gene.23706::Locus_9258_Transcript_4_10_Confidence_0.158_Length_1715::g.23706::m.23706
MSTQVNSTVAAVQSRVEELSKTFQSLEVRKTSEELVESAVKQLQEKLAELRQSLNALYQEKLTDSQKEVVADVLSKALNTLEQGKAGVRYLMQHIDMPQHRGCVPSVNLEGFCAADPGAHRCSAGFLARQGQGP